MMMKTFGILKMLDKVTVKYTLKVWTDSILKMLDKVKQADSILKMLDKVNVKDALKVSNKLDITEVSQQGYLLEKCNVLARGMVKEELCSPMGWEVRYHLMGLENKVGRLEDWEVRYQFKGLTSCKRLDTIEESAVKDPQGLKLMCNGLDAIEESVMVMDLNDVKFKVIEQYQVVCEINLKDEFIGKMMDHPWREFQWECNSMR